MIGPRWYSSFFSARVLIAHGPQTREKSVRFLSPHNSTPKLLTPEQSISLQNSIGSDIIMQLLHELVTKSPGRVPRRCRKRPPHDFERPRPVFWPTLRVTTIQTDLWLWRGKRIGRRGRGRARQSHHTARTSVRLDWPEQRVGKPAGWQAGGTRRGSIRGGRKPQLARLP